MKHTENLSISPLRRICAWSIHLLTASAAIFGLLTFEAITHHHYKDAFLWMALAIFVDAIDGTLARFANVKLAAARVDGALLDNIVDYINYALTPAFFLLMYPSILPPTGRYIVVGIMLLASAFQFTQNEAKTPDNFFKGFPCYWNFVVFYMFVLQLDPIDNLLVLLALCAMVFIPIKYVYPSRMSHLSPSKWVKHLVLFATCLYGACSLVMILIYPQTHFLLTLYTIAFIIFYFLLSIYRTIYPMKSPA